VITRIATPPTSPRAPAWRAGSAGTFATRPMAVRSGRRGLRDGPCGCPGRQSRNRPRPQGSRHSAPPRAQEAPFGDVAAPGPRPRTGLASPGGSQTHAEPAQRPDRR
jgi:hypothetical protein